MEPFEIPYGVAGLARSTGCPLLPVFALRRGRRTYRMRFSKPLVCPRTKDRKADFQALADALASELEQVIRLAPEQAVTFFSTFRVRIGPELVIEVGRPVHSAPIEACSRLVCRLGLSFSSRSRRKRLANQQHRLILCWTLPSIGYGSRCAHQALDFTRFFVSGARRHKTVFGHSSARVRRSGSESRDSVK